MKTITINYHGMKASGATITEAKEKAGAMIEKILEGDYTPLRIHGETRTAIVYREPTGWWYHIFNNENNVGAIPCFYALSGCYETREEATRYACNHIAQNDWNYAHEDTHPLLNNYPDLQKEYTEWCQWQRRYKALRDAGMSDQEAHAKA